MPDAASTPVEIRYSACPHDCPSTCALEVERIDSRTVGRIRGAKDNDYTAGVICAKVARYAERVHHPDRLLSPMQRTAGGFREIGWDAALDETAEAFLKAEARYGSETVWPYYYAGTMGFVQRDGINRLRHLKRYSGQHSTICTTLAWNGFIVGTGALRGADPREMAKSDVVVIWGTNPVNTQVNVMTHAVAARKERGARIVVVDVYRTGTAQQADLFVCVRPGTDGALACAVMHILFRDGYADRAYLARYTDAPEELEAHLAERTPEWASRITGTPVETIEEMAALIGQNPRTYLRLGYGFTRCRNGAVNMHAALSIAAVTGAWQYEGGGAFHNNGAIYGWDKSPIEVSEACDPSVRLLDQTRIGDILTGDPDALYGGPPVTAMLIQNTNPLMVAPDLNRVRAGFARDDLFVCTHEQFMTDTAKASDIVLPATQFLEHDDMYQGGGHQYVILGPRIIDPPGECRSNHDVLAGLAERLGLDHPSFAMTPMQLIDAVMRKSGRGTGDQLRAERWIDCQPPFETAHYLDGFAHPDRKFRFRPDWSAVLPRGFGAYGPQQMPVLPDHWEVLDEACPERPFRMATSPARSFLNSSFTETPTSRRREGRPTVRMRSDDAEALGLANGDRARIGTERGETVLHVEIDDGPRPGVVVVESIWPNDAFETGLGINALTSAEPAAPVGGGVFHDTSVWIRPA